MPLRGTHAIPHALLRPRKILIESFWGIRPPARRERGGSTLGQRTTRSFYHSRTLRYSTEIPLIPLYALWTVEHVLWRHIRRMDGVIRSRWAAKILPAADTLLFRLLRDFLIERSISIPYERIVKSDSALFTGYQPSVYLVLCLPVRLSG